MRVSFDVQRVTRNGFEEPWFVENYGAVSRLYIGDSSRNINRGAHTYVVTYQTDRQIGFFDSHDEIYWNVTGNFWAFPIDRASDRFTAKNGARPKEVEAYTGAFGETGRNATIRVADNGAIYAATTKNLSAREGLTVVATWPLGTFARPTWQTRFSYLMRDARSAECGRT